MMRTSRPTREQNALDRWGRPVVMVFALMGALMVSTSSNVAPALATNSEMYITPHAGTPAKTTIDFQSIPQL